MVTGGGGGIGAATSRLFAQHGAQVVIADIDAECAHRCADEITASGGSARAVVTTSATAAKSPSWRDQCWIATAEWMCW